MTAGLASADHKVDDFIARGVTAPLPRFYGDALVAAARRDPRIVCLCADLPGPTETDAFKQELPERYIEAGIAEANMVGMAAGMARCGEIPFLHSFCVFVTRRAYDQVANQIAYPGLPVKLVGFLPGLTTMLGVSHQAIDDIAMMRALPNMTIIEPSGPEQLGAAVAAALDVPGPVYLRMKRPDGAMASLQARTIQRGRGEILREGADGTIVACGLMVSAALQAADRLAVQGKQVGVVNMPTIKPLDTELVIGLARRTGVVVTAENHSIIGGLGSAIAETLLEAAIPVGFARVGVQDTFAEGGTTPYLQGKYGLTAEAIVDGFIRAAAKRASMQVNHD
ncbi:transketolase family protein [Bradyrhizobium prioriisuperbiae]|uniref:transketolase family protein n=1 Tax=Bradyrhizobium prioriisuperbiae TaxID=2854389 RepID=UPI0028F0FC24|nr:transketolase C-terminal domain-containing protein [Bradyrhizobium prioritasuperba]